MLIKTQSLTPDVLHIVRDAGTEPPASVDIFGGIEQGTFLCRQCGIALFRGDNRFPSSCGWPGFDDLIHATVREQPDPDGRRREVVCARCEAHLGHVFRGERLTDRNIRYCINALSLDFVNDLRVLDTEEIIVAGGCFWGVEYYFKKLPGVLKAEVGYIGGQISNPTYCMVCEGNTGHFEAVRVVFDCEKTSDEAVLKYFFEIHDPGQKEGQGPDIGTQYRSAIFYYNEQQENTAKHVIQVLKNAGYAVATQLLSMATFWKAEDYHQNYYEKNAKEPYCHFHVRRFT